MPVPEKSKTLATLCDSPLLKLQNGELRVAETP
jgi:hypothetical protein